MFQRGEADAPGFRVAVAAEEFAGAGLVARAQGGVEGVGAGGGAGVGEVEGGYDAGLLG